MVISLSDMVKWMHALKHGPCQPAGDCTILSLLGYLELFERACAKSLQRLWVGVQNLRSRYVDDEIYPAAVSRRALRTRCPGPLKSRTYGETESWDFWPSRDGDREDTGRSLLRAMALVTA